MTGTTITIAAPALEPLLARLAAGAGATAPAMKNIGEALVKSTRERFVRQHGPGGVAWAPLSPAWRKTKAARGHDPRILVQRGSLSGLSPSALSVHYRTTADAVEVGTNAPYGAIHQFGGTITHAARTREVFRRLRADKAGNIRREQGFADWRFRRRRDATFAETVTIGAHQVVMPARPYLGTDDADEVTIAEIVEDHLTMAMEGRDAV